MIFFTFEAIYFFLKTSPLWGMFKLQVVIDIFFRFKKRLIIQNKTRYINNHKT